MKVEAVFEDYQRLNEALLKLEQEYPGLGTEVFPISQRQRAHHVTTMWETMGASTGTLLGRIIGLGVEMSVNLANAGLVGPLEGLKTGGLSQEPQEQRQKGVRIKVE